MRGAELDRLFNLYFTDRNWFCSSARKKPSVQPFEALNGSSRADCSRTVLGTRTAVLAEEEPVGSAAVSRPVGAVIALQARLGQQYDGYLPFPI